MQARTRMNLATCLVTYLHSLLSAERYLKDLKMPCWAPLNESVVKKQIEISDKAGIKSANDVQVCVEMIKQGCRSCREKEAELYQVPLQNVSENQSDYDQQMDFALWVFKLILNKNESKNS